LKGRGLIVLFAEDQFQSGNLMGWFNCQHCSIEHKKSLENILKPVGQGV
jgi:hypothetical protein